MDMVLKILPMFAVHIIALALGIICFQNLHTLLNSRGDYYFVSCNSYRQTAALPGCNEHPETRGRSAETLYIMLKKKKNEIQIFLCLGVDLNRYSASVIHAGDLWQSDDYKEEFHKV